MRNEPTRRSPIRTATLVPLMTPLAVALVVALVGGSSTLLTGCSSSAKVDAHTTTVGQELQDLDAAYDKGLLTEDEYKKKRKQILDRR